MALSKYWKSPLTKNEQIKFNQYPSNQYPANSKFTGNAFINAHIFFRNDYLYSFVNKLYTHYLKKKLIYFINHGNDHHQLILTTQVCTTS